MKLLVTTVASLSLIAALSAHAEQTGAMLNANTMDDIQKVAPALEKYAEGPLADLWRRPGLSSRDRSIVTLAALIARNQTFDLRDGLYRALDNGVKPREISEIITHLAFYSGWPNAMAAVSAAKYVFTERNIAPDQLPSASPPPLPLDNEAEAQRARNVGAQFDKVAPALIASGQVAQLPAHLARAMNNGLTPEEAGEMLAQLAFYAGWPNVFTALPIVKEVIEKRLD